MSKILYFVNGLPSQTEIEDARLAGASIRNAQAWHEDDFIEQCYMVMGDPAIVPEPYRHLLKAKPKAQRGRKNADS